MARLFTFNSLKLSLATSHTRPASIRRSAPRVFASTSTSTNAPFPSSQPPAEFFDAHAAATSEKPSNPFTPATSEESSLGVKRPSKLYSSPSDLMLFVSSPFAAWMERLAREQPSHPAILLAPPEQDAMMGMLAAKGQEAELKFLNSEFVSTGKYGNVVDLSHTRDVATTMAAMESGAGVIFQAPLSLDFVSDVDGSSQGSLKGFRGVADFLVKVPLGQAQASSHTSPHNGFGLSYTYQVWDAKLTKRPAPSHVLQLWCYTDMVSQLAASSAAALSSSMNQLNMKKTVESLDVATAATKGPPRAVLVLNAASTPTPIDLAPYGAYYRAAVKKFRAFHANFNPATGPPEPLPLPGESSGRWANIAAALRERRDDLTRVARLPRRHADRLLAAVITKSNNDNNDATQSIASNVGSPRTYDGAAVSVSTLSTLAALPREAVASTAASAGLDPEVLDRHRRQAVLQQETKRRQSSTVGDVPPSKVPPAWDWLEGEKSAVVLAAMLPLPSRGDVFFDLEGHPFADLLPRQTSISDKENEARTSTEASLLPLAPLSTEEDVLGVPTEAGGLVQNESSLKALKVPELKDLLKASNLSTNGKKADLVSRLLEAFSKAELLATEPIEVDTVDGMNDNSQTNIVGFSSGNAKGQSTNSGSSGGLVSREYLWGATVFDTAFDQDPTRQSSIITTLSDIAMSDLSDDINAAPLGSSEFQSLQSSLGEGAGGGLKSRYVCWWAHDADAEVEAFVGFVDWLVARRVEYPNLKVYHYGAYEVSALKRLAGRSGLHEREVDTFLRDRVFVDVYTCVRKCLLLGEPKYSIKNVEKLYLGEDPATLAEWATSDIDDVLDAQQRRRRNTSVSAEITPTDVDDIPTANVRRLREGAEVAKGDDSVVAYQRWLEQPDAPFAQLHSGLRRPQPSQEQRVGDFMTSETKQAGVTTVLSQQLEALRAYNQDDTDSTLLAVLWLRRAVSHALGPMEKDSTAALAVTAVQVESAAAERDEEQAAARLADEERLDKLVQTLRNDQAPCWQSLSSPAVDSSSSASNDGTIFKTLSAPTMVASRRARDTAADSLNFEQREARPVWWRRFAWLEASDKELLSDPDALAGLEILDVSDPDFAPVNTAASSNDDQDNFNGNHDNNSSWAGLGPDGTCEPWKRSPRKKKLCVTYRFDPNTQAGKKVALQASAALQQACANCGQPLPPPTAQLPFFLAVPSEKDCIAGGGAVDNGDGTSSELYDRMKPLRVSVLAFDLTRGLCLVELPPDQHPRGLSLLPDEFVSADPIPAAVRSTCEDWVNDGSWLHDPLYHFLAGHPPELSFSSEEDSDAFENSNGNNENGGGVVFGRQDIAVRAAQHLASKRRNEKDLEMVAGEPPETPPEEQEAAVVVSAADAATAAFNALHPSSYLAIQGPPGTGKTTVGARLIVEAVSRGHRVAITANSHKVIVNLMAKVAYELARQGCSCSSTCRENQGHVGMVKVGGALKEDVAEIAAAAARGEAEYWAGLEKDHEKDRRHHEEVKSSTFVSVRGVVGAKDLSESDSDSNGSEDNKKGSKKKGSKTGGALKVNDLVVGATAWGLSHPAMRGCADWLIVDEAGQVPVPRLLGMGQVLRKSSSSSPHAENEEDGSMIGSSFHDSKAGSGGLVLLGDQMQLSAPTGGTHPGLSGLSALEYLLTSPSDALNSDSSSSNSGVLPGHMGIFLPLSFRLHPNLCRVISDQVYDGKLYSHPGAAQRSLCLLDNSACGTNDKTMDEFNHKASPIRWPSWPPLLPNEKEESRTPKRLLATGQGVSVLKVAHEQFNEQSSEEECAAVNALVQELLDPTRTLLDDNPFKSGSGSGDEGGASLSANKSLNDGRPLTLNDILVVSPYNLQVKRLSARLGPSARVGTVDKFQGQEAPVVIISLATSSFDGTFSGSTPSSSSSDFTNDHSSETRSTSIEALLSHAAADGSAHGDDQVRAAVLDACNQEGSGGGNSRSLGFVLDMRRLNVALSRAQCVAIVVLSDSLAKSLGASSLRQMRALSFACRLLEGDSDGF